VEDMNVPNSNTLMDKVKINLNILGALVLTRNFSFRCARDVMNLGGNLAYQLATAFTGDMINDLARVVSSPPNEAIAAS
jgi:hypothetical protein